MQAQNLPASKRQRHPLCSPRIGRNNTVAMADEEDIEISNSSGESSSEDAEQSEPELMVITRDRRKTAGNRYLQPQSTNLLEPSRLERGLNVY